MELQAYPRPLSQWNKPNGDFPHNGIVDIPTKIAPRVFNPKGTP
jgi:hypothetical protein